MEVWVKNWLDERRAKGERCLEVKKVGVNHYVYRSTTRYNRETKKRDKVSVYLGVLDVETGLIKPKKDHRALLSVRNVREYGNSMILHNLMKKVKTVLEEAFPVDWRKLYALSLVRAQGYVPLKRAGLAWSKLYDPYDLRPEMDSRGLSSVLKRIGTDRKAQALVFRKLASDDQELIYDLSAVLTRSQLNYAEKGYNKGHYHLPQVNLALFCSVKTGMPTMIRCFPGSVRDVKSLYTSLKEMDMTDKTLILDRGFFSDKSLKYFKKERYNFIVPAWRNSRYYNLEYNLDDHFFYHDRLIRYAKQEQDMVYFYMYEDEDLLRDETRTLYKRLDAKQVSPRKFEEEKKKAGRILIASNHDKDEKDLYNMYKTRDQIEKLFDTYKNVLDADRLYLQDNETLLGHVFASFLSLYAYTSLQQLIKKTGLENKYSPTDILQQYSKTYILELDTHNIITDTPKKTEELDKTLKLDVFPKTKS